MPLKKKKDTPEAKAINYDPEKQNSFGELKKFRKLRNRFHNTLETKIINTALTGRNYHKQLKEQMFSSPINFFDKSK